MVQRFFLCLLFHKKKEKKGKKSKRRNFRFLDLDTRESADKRTGQANQASPV
jgi:hypothetical protein